MHGGMSRIGSKRLRSSSITATIVGRVHELGHALPRINLPNSSERIVDSSEEFGELFAEHIDDGSPIGCRSGCRSVSSPLFRLFRLGVTTQQEGAVDLPDVRLASGLTPFDFFVTGRDGTTVWMIGYIDDFANHSLDRRFGFADKFCRFFDGEMLIHS